MKPRFTSTMAVLLALFIVNVGFARTQLLVCRYQCDQDRQVHASPCCGSGAGMHHAGGHSGAAPAGDCPHVDGSRNFLDLSFTVSSAKKAASTASVACAVSAADRLQPAAGALVEKLHTGTSPPGIVTPPLYHLHCALLI